MLPTTSDIAVSHQAASVALATLADEACQGEGVELAGVGALLINLKRMEGAPRGG